jgi:hypothetical protein
MIIAVGLFVAGVVSFALVIRELRKAPEGYEDEHGFYTVHKGAVENRLPDTRIKKASRTPGRLHWPMHHRPAH